MLWAVQGKKAAREALRYRLGLTGWGDKPLVGGPPCTHDPWKPVSPHIACNVCEELCLSFKNISISKQDFKKAL